MPKTLLILWIPGAFGKRKQKSRKNQKSLKFTIYFLEKGSLHFFDLSHKIAITLQFPEKLKEEIINVKICREN